MSAIEEMLLRIHSAWTTPQQGDVLYSQWVAGSPKPPSYQWMEDQKGVAVDLTNLLVRTAENWARAKPLVAEGSPRPRPEIRLRPRL